jgi:hypothetical protein
MKKIILSTLFMASLVFSSAFAFGKTYGRNYSFYGSVDSMGVNPMLSVGARYHDGFHAGDFSASICPINPPESLEIFHAKGLYLFYPYESNFYFGGGLGVLKDNDQVEDVSASLEASVGYEWQNGIFVQGNITTPFKFSSISIPVPGVSMGYGF